MLYTKSIRLICSCHFLCVFIINNCLTSNIERTEKMSNQEEVYYQNKTAKVQLSGTLTIPTHNGNKKKEGFPAVILIAGYGKNNRDYMLGKHKRFLVIADHLTKKGIAVLRFDKRGVGKSTGDYTNAKSRDFADDVLAGIEYLKSRTDIDSNKIGLIGHSEGGMIASMVAAESKDIAFLVSMAGVVQTDIKGLAEQNSKQLKADGASEELISKDYKLRTKIFTILKEEANADQAKTQLQNLINDYCENLSENLRKESENIPFATTKAKMNAMINVFNTPWYRYFLSYKPVEMLKKINIPFLAIYGDRDWIVSAQPSISIISDALKTAVNTDYTILEMPGINHSFQTSKTGAFSEYATIEETISPEALNVISDWILKRI